MGGLRAPEGVRGQPRLPAPAAAGMLGAPGDPVGRVGDLIRNLDGGTRVPIAFVMSPSQTEKQQIGDKETSYLVLQNPFLKRETDPPAQASPSFPQPAQTATTKPVLTEELLLPSG